MPDLFHAIGINSPPQWFYCEPSWHWSPAPLRDHDLWFVASGRGEIQLAERKIELMPNLCFVFRPNDAPRATHDPDNPLVVFAAHFAPLDKMGETDAPLEFPFLMRVNDVAFFVASAHRAETLWRRGDELAQLQSRLLIENLLRQLWDETQLPPKIGDAPILDLCAAIRREPAKTWNLDEMAARVHLSRAQFVRRFRSATGAAPAQFVIQIRLERARHLLLETDLTLEQIAEALGYCSAAFFARQFRQFNGIAPGQLRKS